ncbi:hypothetical protein OAK32_02360, partial [Mariniblastus sp.]|nr:hypothetical protein [Mariniblastus sp.]
MIASAIFGTCRIYAFQGMRMADQGRHHNQSRIVKQLYENGEPKVFDFATPGNQGFQFVNGMIYATFGECPNVLSQLYGFLGLAGALLLWDLICREFELLYARPFLCVMMIALPSVFFWCQGLWKEGPTFFAYCLMFQLCPVGTNKKTGSLSLGIIGSVIALWLRPQMAIAYAAALVLTTLKERANLKVLVTTGVIMVAAFLLLQRLVPAFFAEPDALVSKLGSAYRVRVDADVGSTIGGSPIPILSGINLIFLRPYPFEISNQF